MRNASFSSMTRVRQVKSIKPPPTPPPLVFSCEIVMQNLEATELLIEFDFAKTVWVQTPRGITQRENY